MPIYEYRCLMCGTVSELFAKIGAYSDTLACSNCGSTSLEKLLSSPAIISAQTCAMGNSNCTQSETCSATPSCGAGSTSRFT